MTELEYLESQLADISKRVDEEKENARLKAFADYLRNLYKHFLEAGFSEEQAWWMTGQMFLKGIGANNG